MFKPKFDDPGEFECELHFNAPKQTIGYCPKCRQPVTELERPGRFINTAYQPGQSVVFIPCRCEFDVSHGERVELLLRLPE